MEQKVIYLAGGCYWGVEKYMSGMKGVTATEVGFANGNTRQPTYHQVRYENTGHAETVKVTYDPECLPLEKMLKLFYRIIDPTTVDRQGEDEGHQYRTGIYYINKEDGETAAASLAALQEKVGAPLAVECLPLEEFWPAEEYHQKYLDKNPAGYCHVPFAELMWIQTVDPLTYED